jgi:hypothetical protein
MGAKTDGSGQVVDGFRQAIRCQEGMSSMVVCLGIAGIQVDPPALLLD